MRAFFIGLQFLTRIQLFRQTQWTEEDFGKSVSWFPLIGLIIGVLLALMYYILQPLHVPYLTAAMLVGENLLSQEPCMPTD